MHRIGRTGRKDLKGESYTFFTENDSRHAKQLVSILEEAKQEINPQLKKWVQPSHGGYGNNSRYGSAYAGARQNNFKRNTMGGGNNYDNYRFGRGGQNFRNRRTFEDDDEPNFSHKKNYVNFD